MHELGLTEDILRLALEAATQNGAGAIRQLTLTLSSASHIDPETLRTHFAAISRGTLAEGAELVFAVRAVEEGCRYCGHTFVVHSDLACPACDAPAIPPAPEDELRLESIEVESPANVS